MTADLRAQAILALPWDKYIVDTEHEQHGDYGGDCKVDTHVYCSRCLVLAPLGGKTEASRIIQISPWSGEFMGKVLDAMLRHEQRTHGGVPVE